MRAQVTWHHSCGCASSGLSRSALSSALLLDTEAGGGGNLSCTVAPCAPSLSAPCPTPVCNCLHNVVGEAARKLGSTSCGGSVTKGQRACVGMLVARRPLGFPFLNSSTSPTPSRVGTSSSPIHSPLPNPGRGFRWREGCCSVPYPTVLSPSSPLSAPHASFQRPVRVSQDSKQALWQPDLCST